MQTGAFVVAPGAVVGLPGGDDPASSGRVMDGRVGSGHSLVLVGLFREACGVFQHHTVLDAEIGEWLIRAIRQRQLHRDVVLLGTDLRGVGDLVRQSAGQREGTVGLGGPFELRKRDVLLRPDGGDVRVGEVRQAKVRKDRFRNIDDDEVGS